MQTSDSVNGGIKTVRVQVRVHTHTHTKKQTKWWGQRIRALTWWALLTFRIFTFNLVCNMLIHVLAHTQHIHCVSEPNSESQATKCRLPACVCLFKFSVTSICTTCNLAITKNKEIRKENQCASLCLCVSLSLPLSVSMSLPLSLCVNVNANLYASVFEVASHRHLTITHSHRYTHKKHRKKVSFVWPSKWVSEWV